MKTSSITAAVLSALLVLPMSGVQAARDASYTDHARVLKVQPIYKQSSERDVYCTPRRGERFERRGQYRGDDSYTAEVVGAIVGGAIGNQFGGGRGQDAMTVAGAALGASVAHEMDRGQDRRLRTADRRCKVVEQVRGPKQVAGYRVKYRYDGQTFWTRTRRHPGEWMPVEVTIDPKPARRGRY